MHTDFGDLLPLEWGQYEPIGGTMGNEIMYKLQKVGNVQEKSLQKQN